MWKPARCVLVPTDKQATIVVNPSTNKIQYNKPDKLTSYYTEAGFNVFELHIISDDTIVKDNWCYSERFKRIYQEPNPDFANTTNYLWKVIATTDSSLLSTQDRFIEGYKSNLPQVPQSFIDLFINEFNHGNIIENVVVEYNECMSGERMNLEFYEKIKITPENYININPSKDTWTRDEVAEVVRQYQRDHGTKHAKFGELLMKQCNEWIEKNL